MSTWTGPGTWEALGKGSYPWIPRTTLNFPAVGSLRSLEKRAVRWDPEDAQDLDPWSQERRYRKEQEERGWMWKRMRGWMSKRLYGNGRSSEQLLAPSSALPSPRWLCPGGQSQDCPPPAAGTTDPQTSYLPGPGELPSAALTAAPQSCPVSQRSLPGAPRVSKAPAGTQGRSWEEPQRWSQGTRTQGGSEKAATAAISSQDTGARSHPPGRGGGRGGSCAEHCSPSPQEEPTRELDRSHSSRLHKRR